jgi:hypothetical protein
MLYLVVAILGILKNKNVISSTEYEEIITTLKDKEYVRFEDLESIILSCLDKEGGE